MTVNNHGGGGLRVNSPQSSASTSSLPATVSSSLSMSCSARLVSFSSFESPLTTRVSAFAVDVLLLGELAFEHPPTTPRSPLSHSSTSYDHLMKWSYAGITVPASIPAETSRNSVKQAGCSALQLPLQSPFSSLCGCFQLISYTILLIYTYDDAQEGQRCLGWAAMAMQRCAHEKWF